MILPKIVLQRLVVAGSCVVFYVLAIGPPLSHAETGPLALLALLACVEKLCAVMNLVSVERDWVREQNLIRVERRLICLDRLSLSPRRIKRHYGVS